MREDNDGDRTVATYDQIAYGSSLMKERIVIKVVEKIDVQAEISKLMQIPTYN